MMEIIEPRPGQPRDTVILENLIDMFKAVVYNDDLYWRAHLSVLPELAFQRCYQSHGRAHCLFGFPVSYDSHHCKPLGQRGDIEIWDSTQCLAVLADRR